MDPEIGAFDVDGEGAVPRRFVDPVDRAARRGAGCGQQHVDATPPLDHPCHAGARLGVLADIGGDGDRRAALGLDLGGDFLQSNFVLVDQGEARPLGGEQLG